MATYGGYGLGGFTGGGMGGGGMDMQGFLGMLMQLARRYQGGGQSMQPGQFQQQGGQMQPPQWRDPTSAGSEPPPLSGPFSQGFDPTSAAAQDTYTGLYNQAQQYGHQGPLNLGGPTLPALDQAAGTAYNTAYNKAMFGGAGQRFGARPDYSAGPVKAPSPETGPGMTRQAEV